MASDNLDQNGKLLLDALSAAMRGEGVFWQEESVSWPKLQRLARSHNVLPLLAQAVWDGNVDGMPAGASTLKTAAARITVSQAQRTGDFLLLYRFLNGRGLQPAVMKGIVCRALYPCPEQRPSVDEDFLVDPAEFPAYHAALLEYGLHPAEADADPAAAYEVTYEDKSAGRTDCVSSCTNSPSRRTPRRMATAAACLTARSGARSSCPSGESASVPSARPTICCI